MGGRSWVIPLKMPDSQPNGNSPNAVLRIMAARPHPEQGFRTCLGILALTRTYGAARVDAACRRGISIKARSVTSLRSILQNGLDRAFLDDGEQGERGPVRHGNIRGRDYFH